MGQADNEGTTPAEAMRKAPVQQPQRASEKQAQKEAHTSSTASTQNSTKTGSTTGSNDANNSELSGVIENAKEGKEGVWWLTLKSGIVMVPADKVDADMKAGYFIKLRGAKKHSDKIGDYFILTGLMELSPVQDETPTEDKPLSPEMQEMADDLFGKEKDGQAAVQGMVDSGQLKKASDLPPADKKPGTIGRKRAQRLYALINTNKASNYGLDEGELKKMLQSLPIPIEHLSDLEVGMMEQFEKYCTGAEDWHTFWD